MSIIPDPGPTPAPAPDPGSALTAHDAGAARLLENTQSLVQVVRGYGFISRKHSRAINPTATLPTEFLLAVAVALDASESLRQSSELTGDQIRDVVSFCNAYGPAANEMQLKAEGVLQAVKTQRSSAGQVCLRVYRVARSSNLPSDREMLFPHLENMKRALARGRKKRAAAKPSPETEPAKKEIGNA